MGAEGQQEGESSQRKTGSGSKSGMGAEGQQEEESSQRITGSGSKSGMGAEGQQEGESSQCKTGSGSKSGMGAEGQQEEESSQRITGSGSKSGIGAEGQQERESSQRKTGKGSKSGKSNTNEEVPMNPQAQAFVDRFRQQRSTGSASNFFGDKLASVVPMAKSKKRPPLRRTNAVHGDDDSNDIELDFTMEKKKRTEDHT
jgi:hypothetical protein